MATESEKNREAYYLGVSCFWIITFFTFLLTWVCGAACYAIFSFLAP